MKNDEPLLSSNHRQTTPAATEIFKPLASNIVMNETALNQTGNATTSTATASILNQTSAKTAHPATLGTMTSKENSFLVNSNNRNIINHFFSQVKVRGGLHHNNHQQKPIIKTTDPILIPTNVTTMPNPSSNIFITSGNSATHITIHELQLAKNTNTTLANPSPQSKSLTQQQLTNHVHFTSPLPANPVSSSSNSNGNTFTINTINLIPQNTKNVNNNSVFSTNTPPLINKINVNNINGFHSASVNKLSTTSQNNNNCSKYANDSSNVLQSINNKSFIRSSSFRHKNTNQTTSNSKIGISSKIIHQFNTPYSNIQSNIDVVAPTANVTKDSSKSVENLANLIKTENNSIIPDSSLLSSTRRGCTGDESSSASISNTHTFNRLVKIASNWQAKSRSSSNQSNYQHVITTANSSNNLTTTTGGQQGSSSSKVLERGLISQSKIRQTQMFINDSLEYANSESALLKKLGETTSPQNKFIINGDEQGAGINAAFNRSKSMRLAKTSIKLSSIGSNYSNKPPIVRSNNVVVDSTSLLDASKAETNEPYSNINYWKPNETTTNTLISDVGGANLNDLQSSRNSFILSRKNSRSIEFLNFNQKAGAKLQKLVNNNNSNKSESLTVTNNNHSNEKKNVPTAQMNKLGQFAIETQ